MQRGSDEASVRSVLALPAGLWDLPMEADPPSEMTVVRRCFLQEQTVSASHLANLCPWCCHRAFHTVPLQTVPPPSPHRLQAALHPLPSAPPPGKPGVHKCNAVLGSL